MNSPYRLGILGPGTLGLSIAQWAAECGLRVRLYGRDETHAQQGLARLHAQWDRLLAKGKMASTEVGSAKERLELATKEDRLDGLDALLEALPEDLPLKARAWGALRPLLPPDVLLLTGSSALPVSQLATASGLEGRLLGFHMFVPVRTMKVVELVLPSPTEDDLVQRGTHLAERLQKQVVTVQDGPGYAAARMALIQGLEAMRLLEEGRADAAGIDALMTGGYGHPLGPLALSDRVGLDLRLAIAEQLHASTGDARFAPPAILRRLVGQGHLGTKTGQGFHRWPKEKP